MYIELLALNKSISIDASGKFVKLVEIIDGNFTANIFLYKIVGFAGLKIYPLSQMLSEVHDTVVISKWLTQWFQDVPMPK